MEIKYLSTFKASGGQTLEAALLNKLINIDGIAIDTTINANRWQVPEEDLDFLMTTLLGAQLRANHSEDVYQVIGKVPECHKLTEVTDSQGNKIPGSAVAFKGEVADDRLIEKIFRGYINSVSIQVDSTDIECSKCQTQTRKDGVLVHICPDAWEIVHKPKVRELSIVASPAYQNTKFQPTGFAAAMNASQTNLTSQKKTKLILKLKIAVLQAQILWLLSEKECNYGGAIRKEQGPDKKLLAQAKGGTTMSVNAQQSGSSQQAAADDVGIVNTSPGESAPSQVTYEQLMNQLTELTQKISSPNLSDAEVEAMKTKIANIEGEVAKKATKRNLAKKISDLQKQLQESDDAEAESTACKSESAENASKPTGKGQVANEELALSSNGSSADQGWFKDILKAHKKLVGLQ